MADKTIGALPLVATLVGTDKLELEQASGPTSGYVTVQQIADFPASTELPVLTDGGTSHTIGLADRNRKRRFTSGSPTAILIPTNASVAFPIGSVVPMRRAGTGSLTVSPDTGVTLNIPAGLTAVAARQGSEIAVHKVGTNEWDITGDLT